MMLVSLTVGKVDAGLAILLTRDKRLIEFPSVLLPAGVSSGSIVDIQVSRNAPAEETDKAAFDSLQLEIYSLFGQMSPSKPILRVRNATQTSVVLEWDPIDLATATLRSLALYRNNSKAGNIPNPITHHSTKISGLAVDTEYFFHLVLRTSAGTFASDKVTIKTHKMTDLSGITVCPGVMSSSERERLNNTVQRIGAKPVQDHVRIDTTHFICTEGRGQGWERAQEMNIPIVSPQWLEACEQEGRIVGVRLYYLGADPRPARQSRVLPPQPQSPSRVEQPSHPPAVPSTRNDNVVSASEQEEVETPTEEKEEHATGPQHDSQQNDERGEKVELVGKDEEEESGSGQEFTSVQL